MEHQSILKVYEIFADDFKGEVRIVMEYLKLKTLGHLIKKKYQFSGKIFFEKYFSKEKKKKKKHP